MEKGLVDLYHGKGTGGGKRLSIRRTGNPKRTKPKGGGKYEMPQAGPPGRPQARLIGENESKRSYAFSLARINKKEGERRLLKENNQR